MGSEVLESGDTFLGLALDHGDYLTHGMKINVSGNLYNPVSYHVRRQDFLVDMEEVETLAHEHRPKLIVDGWSAYPRQLDFADNERAKGSAHRAADSGSGGHPHAGLPDWDWVTATWWTKKIGGLHRNDFVMAARTDETFGG